MIIKDTDKSSEGGPKSVVGSAENIDAVQKPIMQNLQKT